MCPMAMNVARLQTSPKCVALQVIMSVRLPERFAAIYLQLTEHRDSQAFGAFTHVELYTQDPGKILHEYEAMIPIKRGDVLAIFLRTAAPEFDGQDWP